MMDALLEAVEVAGEMRWLRLESWVVHLACRAPRCFTSRKARRLVAIVLVEGLVLIRTIVV